MIAMTSEREAMTLEQVREWHLRAARLESRNRATGDMHLAMAEAIKAHLSQPAQAVDVEKVREVIATVRRIDPHWSQLSKLTAAIGEEK